MRVPLHHFDCVVFKPYTTNENGPFTSEMDCSTYLSICFITENLVQCIRQMMMTVIHNVCFLSVVIDQYLKKNMIKNKIKLILLFFYSSMPNFRFLTILLNIFTS